MKTRTFVGLALLMAAACAYAAGKISEMSASTATRHLIECVDGGASHKCDVTPSIVQATTLTSKTVSSATAASTAFLLDTSVNHTSGTLVGFSNNAVSKFAVDYTGTLTAGTVPWARLSGVPLRGATGSISGDLTVGVCNTGTAAVTGATTAMAAFASPATYPGDGVTWMAYVSAADTVTVKECGLKTITPTASAFQVAVVQ